MEKLYQQLKGEDFEILAVSIDATGAKAVGADWSSPEAVRFIRNLLHRLEAGE